MGKALGVRKNKLSFFFHILFEWEIVFEENKKIAFFKMKFQQVYSSLSNYTQHVNEKENF